MRILITGAGGMLGADFCKILSAQHEILGLGRHPAPHVLSPYQILDLADKKGLSQLLSSWKPQVVIHCAAMTNVDACELNSQEAFKQNVDILDNLIDAANVSNSFILFLSTDYVFDGNKKGEYAEEDPVSPVSVYGKTKAKAEALLEKKAGRYCILRVSWLYGLYGKSFPRTLLELSEKQKNFNIVSDQMGRPTYTLDLARAVSDIFSGTRNPLELLDHQIFHLGNTGIVSWYDFGREIFSVSHKTNIAVKSISSNELSRPARRPLNSVLALDKAKSRLGIAMRSWEEALPDFVAEFSNACSK